MFLQRETKIEPDFRLHVPMQTRLDHVTLRLLILHSFFFILFHVEGVVFFCLNQRNEFSELPLRKRMTRHVLTVEKILQFPDDYQTKGILSLPYGDIVEPFEAW